MSQFTLYKNKNPKSKAAYPFLLNVQCDLFSDLQTRVVVPLTKLTSLRKRPIKDLTPIIEVEGSKYLLLTPQLAGVAVTELGQSLGVFSSQRDEIVAALDFLITGV